MSTSNRAGDYRDPNAAAKAPPRALELDLLRGFAIILMWTAAGLSRAPWSTGTHLPAWMHPAQFPPPTYTYEWGRVGLTWGDLVAPLFLFCLGAAIPLALGARRDRGESAVSLVGRVLFRGAFLLAAAIYLARLAPAVLSPTPAWREALIALAGFVALVLLLAPLPHAWPRRARWGVRLGALAVAAALLLLFPPAAVSGRRPPMPGDDYLIVIANVWTTAALLWLAVRGRVYLLLLSLGATIALCLGHEHWWLTKWMWHWTRGDTPPLVFSFFEPLLPYLARFARLEDQQHLLVVVPGMLAGGVLRRRVLTSPVRREPAPEYASGGWFERGRDHGGTALAVLLVVGTLAGVQARWTWATAAFAIGVGGLGIGLLLWRSRPGDDQRWRRTVLFACGWLWLIAGLALDAWVVGVRRVEPTLSFHLVSAGLVTLALVGCVTIVDAARRLRVVVPVAALGRHALLAYAALRGPAATLVSLAR